MSDVGFELVDHTAETILRIHAPTFGRLIEQATRAFQSLVPDRLLEEVHDGGHDFDIDAGDRTATLVEWINELVYLAEAELWIPVDPVVEEVGDSGIHLRANRLSLSEPFVLVKAATLHGAEIRERDGGLEVEVTLDI